MASASIPPDARPADTDRADVPNVPFGVNELRLNGRQWLLALLLVVLVAKLLPWGWSRIERFDTGPDYRLPYALSKDYWLYERRLKQVTEPNRVLVVGDSVVWGEYVLPDGTLPHFLSQEAGEPGRFVNAGINGMFPLALDGLYRCYGGPVRGRKVLLHCNLLWMSSPKADLSTAKEEQFNHSGLVPQFSPRLPCYQTDAQTRLSALVERNVDFLGWIQHLQTAYLEEKSLLSWTLADDGGDPPRYPHAWQNPFAQIGTVVPSAPAQDPERGPDSPRHRAWSQGGAGPTRFDWVALDRSLQWQGFQRLVRQLRDRGNDVLVVLGPFNEPMILEESRPGFRRLHDGIRQWFTGQGIPHVVPEPLPPDLFADASHPLTEGYHVLAQRLYQDAVFRKWLGSK